MERRNEESGKSARVANMARLYHEEGLTMEEVAAREGISRERVRQLFVRHNVPRRKGHRRPVVNEDQLRTANTSPDRPVAEMAEELGCSEHVVRDGLKRHGLERVRRTRPPGFTDEELLEHMRQLAARLGHTPGLHDLSREPGPSHTTYVRRFGGLRKAQEAAGLEPNPRGFQRVEVPA